MLLPLISILIPVYNADKTLQRCIASLEEQTYPSLEVIFVDDGSTDESVKLVQAFQQRVNFAVKLLQQEQNQGVAATRNRALDEATGEYIYFVDADDWIEKDAIEKLVQLATSQHLDIVGCNWYLAYQQGERKMNQPIFSSPLQALQLMMQGRMKWNLWLFMVRRLLYENIRFIPGQDMGEDMLVMHRLFLKAQKVGFVEQRLYHYAQPNLSQMFSDDKITQVTQNMALLEDAIKKSSYAKDLLAYIPSLKLAIKLPLLITDSFAQYRKWYAWWPETNSRAFKDSVVSCRIRCVQGCAAYQLWLLVWSHYQLVYQIVNKLLYR